MDQLAVSNPRRLSGIGHGFLESDQNLVSDAAYH